MFILIIERTLKLYYSLKPGVNEIILKVLNEQIIIKLKISAFV